MIVKLRKTWRNTIKKYHTQPLKYVEPESLEDIREIILEAEKNGFPVRAVGGGHSFSDVALTGGYLLNLRRLKRVADPDVSQLKPGNYKNFVEAEAGITIEAFNQLMDNRGLCVQNMGGIDNQTLAGAMSTGTHGTGIESPAFYGMMRSIVLVASDAKVYRVEPAAGITDREKYNETGIELIQDDDRFNSLLVNLGCMGVIYSLVMELQPMYWLKESKELCYWHEVKEMLADRSLFETDADGNQKYRGIMLQLTPYPGTKGHRRCIIVRHQLLPGKPRFKFGDLFRNIFTRLGTMPIFYWLSVALVRYIPKAIPWLINNSLKSLKDRSYISKGYKVLYQGVEYVKIRAYDCEFAFDLKDNSCIDAIDELMERALYLAKNHKLYQSAPFGLRFVKDSEVPACPTYHKTVCYIDTPFLLHTIGSEEMLNQYQDAMFRFGGIPHWGKIHNRLFHFPELIGQFYPAMDRWLDSFYFFNPKGTFSNEFSYRLTTSVENLTETPDRLSPD